MVRAVLDGVRVVEWSTYQAGPAAGAMLADLGAEVLKIEEPVRGDGLRSFRTSAGGIPVHLANGCNVLFEENNRNKKSFACDLKHPEGLQAVYQLIEHSDVFLTNFRPHVVQRIGLDYDTLRVSNPRLVFASAAGLGHRGPDAGIGTIDYVAQARSGVMVSAESLSGTMEPVILPPGIGDRITATYLAYGVVCALLARERFGAGQEVRTNQLSSYVSAAAFSVMLAISQHRAFGRDRKTAPNPLVNFYRCRDDTWIMLGCQEDFYWDRFCLAIEATFLLTDPRFASAEARARNSPDLVKILDDIFETRPFDEWAGVLRSWDCRYSRVNSFMELPRRRAGRRQRRHRRLEQPQMGSHEVRGLSGRVRRHTAPVEDSSAGVGRAHGRDPPTGLWICPGRRREVEAVRDHSLRGTRSWITGRVRRLPWLSSVTRSRTT